MKILQVISSLNPSGGGPCESIKQFGTALSALGHQIEVVCLDKSESPWIDFYPFKVYSLGSFDLRYQFSKQLLTWLKTNAGNYDCIIINGLWQYSSFGTWQALGWLKKEGFVCPPYFVFTHGMLDPWFKRTYPLKHLKKWLYWPWAEYRVLRDAKAVLFTCQEERLLARQSFWMYQCNEIVVNFGTAAPPSNIDLQVQRFWESYPDLGFKRIILFLGRIHPKKGCDLLVRAFAQVVKSDPSLHLIMAGPDSNHWQDELQCIAKELNVEQQITWTGMLSGDLKWGAFRVSEAFILPSHQENFGLAVAEALACSLPVLISNKVNIWREVEAAGAGFVANDDFDGTLELLQQWVSLDSESQETMRQAAYQCFVNRFEIGNAAHNLAEVLDANVKIAPNLAPVFQ